MYKKKLGVRVITAITVGSRCRNAFYGNGFS